MVPIFDSNQQATPISMNYGLYIGIKGCTILPPMAFHET